MSILIKGMEMPTKENAVVLITPSGDIWMIGNMPNEDTHLVKAKAVPVPPHGRGIDADALKVSLVFAEKTAKWAVPALRAVLMVIDEMPTILPAEETKEET